MEVQERIARLDKVIAGKEAGAATVAQADEKLRTAGSAEIDAKFATGNDDYEVAVGHYKRCTALLEESSAIDPSIKQREEKFAELATRCKEGAEKMAKKASGDGKNVAETEHGKAALEAYSLAVKTVKTKKLQAMDLVGRKMLRDGGQAFAELLREMEALDDALAGAGARLTTIRAAFQAGMRALRDSSRFILEESARDENLPGAAAFNFMMLFGIVCGGWQMARAALVAAKGASNVADRRFLNTKLATARFYADQILPRAQAYAFAVTSGSASVMALDEEDF